MLPGEMKSELRPCGTAAPDQIAAAESSIGIYRLQSRRTALLDRVQRISPFATIPGERTASIEGIVSRLWDTRSNDAFLAGSLEPSGAYCDDSDDFGQSD